MTFMPSRNYSKMTPEQLSKALDHAVSALVSEFYRMKQGGEDPLQHPPKFPMADVRDLIAAGASISAKAVSDMRSLSRMELLAYAEGRKVRDDLPYASLYDKMAMIYNEIHAVPLQPWSMHSKSLRRLERAVPQQPARAPPARF